jgi:phospholipid/cholesterol/gamma-HCH transport system substrate-binding protein
VADLRALQPILRNLVESGDSLPRSLEILLTIPFADNSLNVIKGDFANIDVTLDLDLAAILSNILGAPEVPGVGTVFDQLQLAGNTGTARTSAGGTPGSGAPGVPLGLPGLTGGTGG